MLPTPRARRRSAVGPAFGAFVLCAGFALPASFAAAVPGIDVAGFDPKVRPQDDLFVAFNGAWLAKAEFPPDRSWVGADTALSDTKDAQLRQIVEDLAARPEAQGTEQKVAVFYRAFVDEAAIDRAGLGPVMPELAAIDAMATRSQLAGWFGRGVGGAGGPIHVYVDSDPKRPALYAATAWQDGLGLPDRDYYLKKDPRFLAARRAYATYLATLLRLAGIDRPDERAAGQLAFETRLAAAQWDRARTYDPVKTYNPMTLTQLGRSAPGFDWAAFAAGAGLPADQRLIVGQPSYATAMARLVAREPLETWKVYAKLRVLDAAAAVLPASFREAQFAYRGVALQGLEAQRPRWKLGIAALDESLGEALGRVYVERHFPPAAKARMQEMVTHLLKAYGQSIDRLTWMSPATRTAAKAKLAAVRSKIGYPDRWRDYSALEVREGDAFGNQLRSARFEWARQAARVGRPIDRDEWGMTPQTINAYYDPGRNEFVFPAAILQPPYFDMSADDALNYGATGSTIGHEISHGFDDGGSQYDAHGMLRNWWSAADRKAFDKLTTRLVAQYDRYEVLPGKHVNGKLTLGENIADLSGLQIAAKAYLLSLGGKEAPVLGGFTGMQRFFIGYSQSWREKVREEDMLARLTADPHSPAGVRVNGAAINSDAYHEAFGTKPGDRMWKAPGDRIRIW